MLITKQLQDTKKPFPSPPKKIRKRPVGKLKGIEQFMREEIQMTNI